MLNQAKALLDDAQLRQQIKKATSLEEAIALIKTAGAKEGYQFSSDSLSQLLQSQPQPLKRLEEQELLMIAGGRGLDHPNTFEPGCTATEDGFCPDPY
ncbi:MAG: Nif11-like leader peptide family natural product precursor [Cyanobacteria bacterium J06638_38]